MPATRLGLYELLAPQFLLGFTFPDFIDKYLSALGVDELRTVSDERGVVYTGIASFTGEGGAAPLLEHRSPAGAVFRWSDYRFGFRLLLPRDGAPLLNDAVTAFASAPGAPPEAAELRNLFANFGPVNQDFAAELPTEFPGIRFRLELMIPLLTLHLKKSWVPGKVVEGRVVPDPDLAGEDVRFVLPKIVLEYEQGNDPAQAPRFRLKSWGNAAFDAPADLEAGEIVRMQPPIALHKSGRVAFGIDQILVDFSPDHTPPEILQRFGTDEGFEGLFVKSARVYYADEDKDFAFHFAVHDVLISFDGEVSLEAELHLLGPEVQLNVSVELYNGPDRIEYNRGAAEDPAHPNVLTGGSAMLPNTGAVQVHITGGVPPILVSVVYDDGTDRFPLWDPDENIALISPGMFNRPPILHPPGTGRLEITVEDSNPAAPLTFSQTLNPFTLTAAELASAEPDGLPGDRERDNEPAVLTVADTPPEGVQIVHTPSASGVTETITVRGAQDAEVHVEGVLRPLNARGEFTIEVAAGATVPITIALPAIASREEKFNLYFEIERPRPGEEQAYIQERVSDDGRFLGSVAPSGTALRGPAALREWIQTRLDHSSGTPDVDIDAHASFERMDRQEEDNKLSQRRLAVAQGLVNGLAALDHAEAHGFSVAKNTPVTSCDLGAGLGRTGNPCDRVAVIAGQTAARPAATINASITRPAPVTPPDEAVTRPAPPPPPPAKKKPPVFRRLSLRLRIERNDPVLFEVSGKLDFETEMEAKLRNRPDIGTIGAGEHLQLRQRAGASGDMAGNPEDGVIDFTLNIIYDTATHFLSETLTLGAAPGDRDGLLEMQNDSDSRLKNIFGAILLFTPVINSAADAIDAESAGSWVPLAVSLAVPITIGGLSIFRTRAITLYGGELRLRQYLPPGETLEFTDASLLFDYGVAFEIVIAALGIDSCKPFKVRYKAVGFNLHFPNGVSYQPVFDTSKGYEIDIADPACLRLPGVLGELLKVLAARIARFNPLTLELDLGLKVDLGVVTVDRFKVKVPLDPPGVPSIIPSGVSIDLANVLTGSGYVDIRDDLLRGALDITLVAVKLRIAASLAIESITQGQRKATAVFAGITVEFPSPIVIAATGLGLYGLAGLFAMHYKRLENPPAPGDSVSPALRWLEKAGGEPQQLVNADGELLWGAELDRWSFGIGVILGTLEGAFLINLRGMFVLELPGPRILIFVKIQIIKNKPRLGDGDLTVGVLGLVDLDFRLQQLTIGIIIDYEIEKLIELKIPIEIFFKLDQPKNWHLHIGTFEAPVSAKILNLVNGRGYFMISGNDIPLPIREEPVLLPGIAVATGLEASIILGSTDIGLYLKVAVGAHLGIAFSPFFIAGLLYVDGKLRLFIVSIEAHGKFEVEAPDPTYVHGEICGKVSFFFFSVQGCVGFTIGSPERELPAPALLRNVFLQSHAPIIASGQGGDRPIDASLGDALMWETDGDGDLIPPEPDDERIMTVPIDTVLVLQMQASPLVSAYEMTAASLIGAPVTPPGLTGEGWVNVGGGRQVRYLLKEISLNPALPDGAEQPPATWRLDRAPGRSGVDTNTDLALFSRVPTTASRALERSTELDTLITTRWQGACNKAAPPACVLWTFCDQPIGPSGDGWHLDGIAEPDPPDTFRHSLPPTDMFVEEPAPPDADILLNLLLANAAGLVDFPARVIGRNGDDIEQQKLNCSRALQLPNRILRRISDKERVPLTKEAKKYLEGRPPNQWIIFHTGPATSVTFFIAFERAVALRIGKLLIRELDAAGNTLKERSIFDFALQTVTGVANGLPAGWTDPAGPWRGQILPVAGFLAGVDFSALQRVVFEFAPLPETHSIQIMLAAAGKNMRLPRVIVGAVEVCSRQEQDRFLEGEQIQSGEQQTLTGYLNGGDLVPLLQPNQRYDLTVRYDVESKAKDGAMTTESDVRQRFSFKTDAEAPRRLDPYVLGTTPDNETRYHFYEEPVKIVFNDLAVLQLFAEYGKRLRLKLHAADGVPVAPEDPEISTLDPVTAELSGPYRDLLQAFAEANLLACLGEVRSPQHGSFTAPVALRPLMAYVMDIEAVGSSAPPAEPVPGTEPVRPLYRRSFSTSKFANLGALVDELRARRIHHRALPAAISGLPAPGGGSVAIAEDQAIQDALLAAGEMALPAAGESEMTVYWARRNGDAHFSPHVILVDAAEPLWRSRSEPRLETVPDQDDPAFQRVVPQQVAALEIVEQSADGPFISHFVRSPGGTRTLAFFADTFTPPPAGATVQLAAHRLPSALYGLSTATEMLPAIILGPMAPWEEDNE